MPNDKPQGDPNSEPSPDTQPDTERRPGDADQLRSDAALDDDADDGAPGEADMGDDPREVNPQ